MLDAASLKSGGRVIMVSSLDEEHPGDNAIDGNDRTFWISTGLYPQELLLQLCYPCWVSGMSVASSHVREMRIEACHEEQPVNFKLLADSCLNDSSGGVQVKDLSCPTQDCPIRYIRMIILSGWHDFCTVHRLQVKAYKPDGVDMPPGSLPPRSSEEMNRKAIVRRSDSIRMSLTPLEVPPNDMGKRCVPSHPDEVDAPRVSHSNIWEQSDLLDLPLQGDNDIDLDQDPLSPKLRPLRSNR